ncbi:MAG: hypothetical protein HW416_103 [Chloroflexi bacterium]|nr:hypothetical protein [Chloroflexota bacterium]
MLGMRTYTQDYIDACRSRVDSALSVYRNLVMAARDHPSDKTLPDPRLEAFEATFFNNMILVLDYLFVHRLRTVEGKDGNPLNEVRVMANSMLLNNNIMSADKSIALSAAKSLLKHQVGDEIKLSEADFRLISKAFFAEIERKYL